QRLLPLRHGVPAVVAAGDRHHRDRGRRLFLRRRLPPLAPPPRRGNPRASRPPGLSDNRRVSTLPGPTEWVSREEVGVGPWPGEWPEDERYDPELLAEGDRRNVVDAYRYWRREAIVSDVDSRRHPFHVAIENFQHDHNIGTVVRTANAFA